MSARLRISLLSPVYNESGHIQEMLLSVIAQDHQDWELLLVDDGSTDNTLEIVREAAAGDSRIKVVSEGVKLRKVPAFNLAYAASTGDVIAILGGDDTLPPDSLSARAAVFEERDVEELTAAFFKLRMTSSEPKFDGIVLPRGERGSRSGPSLTVSRRLADLIFPIPEQLVSEDIWLGEAADALATRRVESAVVVVNYRVHAGNSNPRHKSFPEMDRAMSRRNEALPLLLSTDMFALSDPHRERLENLLTAERHRHDGSTLKVLAQRKLPIIDRLAIASMSSAPLFRLRTRFYKFFSGRRGR